MTDRRLEFKHKLHDIYAVQAYDNWDIWAVNMTVELDGIEYNATMARAFHAPDHHVEAVVRAELYVANMDLTSCRMGDIDARLWTDVNDRGFVDERGNFRNALGFYVPMHMVVDGYGVPVLLGNNLVFESDVIRIDKTGVFHYTVEFSADDKTMSEPSKAWISVNDIALNWDGIMCAESWCELGRPEIHQIAWLVYSDVALLDLPFNKPLQNYLSGVAPFWMRMWDLDGVRIDAGQTVDRPFLKQIKNRINMTKDDAIVLGETLCDLDEAVDIPVADLLSSAPVGEISGTVEDFPQLLALLRNIQCSLIDATAGTAHNTNLAHALEWGSAWGEEERSDFEEPTLLLLERVDVVPIYDTYEFLDARF